MNLIELVLAAIAPCLAIIIYIYWRDKFDREPLSVMLICYFYGIVSAAPAIYLSDKIATTFNWQMGNGLLETAAFAFIVVGFSEELSKFIFLRFYAFPKKVFNEPYDGITYSVMVSMGFASIENVLYMIQHGHEVIYLRAFTAVPAHASFAILMGYFVGLAKFKKARTFYLLIGLFAAVFFHGLYDFFLFIHNVPLIFIGAFISLFIAIWLSIKAIRIHTKFSPFNTGV